MEAVGSTTMKDVLEKIKCLNTDWIFDNTEFCCSQV